MSTSSIILAKDLDLSKVTYDEPRKLDNGGKMIYVSFKRQPIRIQTPRCYVPFGVNVYKNDDTNTETHSIDMSFDGKDTVPAMKDFYNKIRMFDEMNVSKGFEYHQSWFRKKYQSKEVIEALYTTMIKYPKDKNGDFTTDWPPTLKFKLPMDKNGKYTFETYNTNNELIDIKDVATKGSRMIAILKCNGIWLAGGKFGMSWKVEQIQITPPSKLTGYCIKIIEEEMIDGCVKDTASVDSTEQPEQIDDFVEEPSNKDNTYVEDSEDEDEDDDVDELEPKREREPEPEPEPAPVQPEKPKKKVVRKKAST